MAADCGSGRFTGFIENYRFRFIDVSHEPCAQLQIGTIANLHCCSRALLQIKSRISKRSFSQMTSVQFVDGELD